MELFVLMVVSQGWWRTYDGGGNDWSYSVCVDDSDNVIVAGNSYSNSSTGIDGHIWKYDPNGTLLWHVAIPSPGSEWLRGVDTDDNGNIYVVMTDYSYDEIRVLKYDLSGGFRWNYSFSPNPNALYEGTSICVDGNMVFATGYENDTLADTVSLVLLYIDTTGTLVRSVFWSGRGTLFGADAYGHAVAVTPSGNPVVGGQRVDYPNSNYKAMLVEFSRSDGSEVRRREIDYGSTREVVEDIDIAASGDLLVVIRLETTPKSAYVGRYTSTFSSVWQRSIQSPSARRSLYGVAIGPDDTVLVAGLWENTAGNRDFWLRKYTWTGSQVWDTLIDHTPGTDDWAEECAWDSHGYVIASGGTTPSNQDMLVYKLPIQQVYNPEPSDKNALSAFPNPFKSSFQISGGKAPFALYDATGRLVLRTDNATGLGRGLEPGVYFLQDAAGRRIRLVKR